MAELDENSILGMLGKAQALSEAMRHAYRPVPEIVEVSDRTKALTLTIEDHGTRVTRVLLAADWKRKISPANLGAAVMETFFSVRLENVKDFFEEVSTTVDGAAPVPEPAPPPIDLATLAGSLNWDVLGEMLETVHRALDAASEGATPDTASEEAVVGRSENRRVEIAMIGNQPSSVTIDEKWAEKAGRQQISDALRQAFESVYAEAAARPPEQGRNASLLGDLQSVINKVGITLPPSTSGSKDSE